MAKKSSVERNEKRKRIVLQYAARRAELKKTIRSSKSSYEDKEEAWKALRNLPRDASPIRVRNRCATTGRPRAFYRKFGLCRLELRLRSMRGELPGVTKSSW